MQPGGVDIPELLRRLGEEALVHEAESQGLSPRAGRMRCPFEGCATKGPERERDAVIYAGGHPRVHCYSCSTTGDLVDVLERTRGWTRAEALAHLQGQPSPPPRPRPQLRVVGGAVDEAGKLTPAEAKRAWDGMAVDDEQGLRYLEGRGLVRADWLRFATEAHPDGGVKSLARRGYRLAALLTDVVGNPRGAQVRLSREARTKEAKVMSVKGSAPSRGFFGRPELVEASPVVVVAEGLADTLSAGEWCAGHVEAVVGAAGMGFLVRIADELEAAGIGLAGKLFVLLPQNDRPANKSRREFVRLKQRLHELGALTVMVQTPAQWKDIAEWRRAQPDAAWPPVELQKAMMPEPGDETPAEQRRIVVAESAVAIPAQVVKDNYGQDFTTLCALLDDPSVRESIGLRGELTWCEMTWRVRVGKTAVAEHDLSAIRLGLEAYRSSNDKPLKFEEGDIAKAGSLLARRKPVHLIGKQLREHVWDGTSRVEEMARALGVAAGSFGALLLRRWLVGTAARGLEPGCKMDTALVLIGKGGAKKSMFFEVMGGEYFTDAAVEVNDKDGKLIMREAWIVEWGELDEMRRSSDYNSVKRFLSQRIDKFRKPYGHDIITAPRHAVIVGTSNPKQFLTDPDGNRRFWPVEASHVDIRWFRANRVQLWAEAVALYDAAASCADCRPVLPHERCPAHRWYLDDAENEQLAEWNREFEEQDGWHDPISDWLDENRFMQHVTVAQVLHEAVGIKEVSSFTKADEMRAAAVLRQLKWTGPTRQRPSLRRVYTRPEGAQ